MKFSGRGWVIGLALLSLPSSAFAKVMVEPIDGEDTAIIVLTGEIEPADEVAFRKVAIEHPSAVVFLDSPGGALMPALAIGRMVRISGFATVVARDRQCASACALIWLAGSPRLLEAGGMIGFHASYREEDGNLIETGVGNAIVGHYLSQLNLTERAVIFATSASPHTVTWLNAQNKVSSGIDFEELGGASDLSKAPLGSLDALFKFEDPASCDMSDGMLAIFRGLVQMNQKTWEASQGKPVQLPGSPTPITPTFSRNRESDETYDAREVFAALPVNATWLGLRVIEIQYVFLEQSSNYEYRIVFDSAPEVVTRTLNRHGFRLPPANTAKTFEPAASPSYGMAVVTADRGSAWICGTRMFY